MEDKVEVKEDGVYIVVVGHHVNDLVRYVNEKLLEDYYPLGGIAVSKDGVAQAMIRGDLHQ